jgi:hypothetical protein
VEKEIQTDLRVRVGKGRGVSRDYRKAVNKAQAYRRLQRISSDKNRPMKEVAEAHIRMLGSPGIGCLG